MLLTGNKAEFPSRVTPSVTYEWAFFAPKERSESDAPSELGIPNRVQALPGLANIEHSFGAKKSAISNPDVVMEPIK